jgi:hypothetical protein
MNRAVLPVPLSTHQPRRYQRSALKLGRLPRLARVLASIAAVIRRSDEERVVSRYEGRSWCDSTDRELNYEIMTSRRTEDPR